jgi:hypothetical protein
LSKYSHSFSACLDPLSIIFPTPNFLQALSPQACPIFGTLNPLVCRQQQVITRSPLKVVQAERLKKKSLGDIILPLFDQPTSLIDELLSSRILKHRESSDSLWIDALCINKTP